MQAD
jgi:hypothetical protein